MIDRKDAERIVAYTQHRLDELAKPEVWDKYTRHMECGELKEFKQGCVDDEIIIEALKKQIPMVPVTHIVNHCPVCNEADVRDAFCPHCGQKLKWGDS